MLGVGHRCSLILRKTARSCDGDDSVGETLKKARRSADPSHSRGTGHPTSRGFADSVDVLARGARILVRFTHKDGAVGIKTTGLRPAAASGSVLRPSPYYPTRSTRCAREGDGSNLSPKYCVSCATRPSRNSMMLTT